MSQDSEYHEIQAAFVGRYSGKREKEGQGRRTMGEKEMKWKGKAKERLSHSLTKS